MKSRPLLGTIKRQPTGGCWGGAGNELQVSSEQHRATQSSMKQLGAAQSSREQLGAALSSRVQLGAAGSSTKQYGAARGSVEQYGAARGSMGQNGAAWGSTKHHGAAWGSTEQQRQHTAIKNEQVNCVVGQLACPNPPRGVHDGSAKHNLWRLSRLPKLQAALQAPHHMRLLQLLQIWSLGGTELLRCYSRDSILNILSCAHLPGSAAARSCTPKSFVCLKKKTGFNRFCSPTSCAG